MADLSILQMTRVQYATRLVLPAADPTAASGLKNVAITIGDLTGATPYTVETLPAGELGMRACVTDATSPAFLQPVVGGGTAFAPVVHNGTTWVVG